MQTIDQPIETTAIARRENTSVAEALTVDQIIGQVTLIQRVMQSVMKEGEHYGTIPGCGNKKTLLKPGAEKLGMTFRLAPDFEETVKELPNGHREYHIKCTLYSIGNNTRVGQGVGCCSTMESKFRYRTENTGQDVPKAYWEHRDSSLLGGPTYLPKKVDGKWLIFHKVEHDNPSDYHNTCLKMAKKRAHVDAILTATAASDCFVQDLEDLAENGVIDVTPAPPPTKRAVAPAASESEGKYDATALKEKKAKFLKAFSGEAKFGAWCYCVEHELIRRGEALDKITETKVPESAAVGAWLQETSNEEESPSLRAQFEEIYADSIPGAEHPSDAEPVQEDFSINVERAEWQEAEVPFGKDKGAKFGDLDGKALWWWFMCWAAEPLKGYTDREGKGFPPSERDKNLYALLNKHKPAVVAKYKFRPPQPK